MSLGERSVPIGERTSDNWGVCAGRRFPGKHALLLISLNCLAVTGAPLARPPAPEGLGGRSRTISPCRKAVQRREETADHQFVGGREPVWPAPSSKGPGAALRTAPTLGGGSAAGKGEP